MPLELLMGRPADWQLLSVHFATWQNVVFPHCPNESGDDR